MINILGHSLIICEYQSTSYPSWIDYICKNCNSKIFYQKVSKIYYDNDFYRLEYNCNEMIIKNLLE